MLKMVIKLLFLWFIGCIIVFPFVIIVYPSLHHYSEPGTAIDLIFRAREYTSVRWRATTILLMLGLLAPLFNCIGTYFKSRSVRRDARNSNGG